MYIFKHTDIADIYFLCDDSREKSKIIFVLYDCVAAL